MRAPGSGRIAGAYAYLLGRTARNALWSRLRKVREPRYAVALAVGLLYFGWLVGAVWLDWALEAPGVGEELETVAPLLLAALVAWWWLRGGYESALAFSPAEAHFLFTAPLTRRHLLHLKLLRSLGGLLVTAIFVTLFLRTGRLPFLFAFASFLLLVGTLQLHQLGSSLARAGAARHGWAGVRRMWIPLLLLGLAAVALAWSFWAAVSAVRAAPDLAEAVSAAGEALGRPVPRTVLLPFRWVLGPSLASDVGGWLAALPAALGVLAVHYLWVVRSDAAFEEAAAEAGRRRAEQREALRTGRLGIFRRKSARARPTRLPLSADGPRWRAVVWKNGVGILRDFPVGALLVALPLGVGALGLLAGRLAGSPAGGVDGVVILVLVSVGALALFGPIGFRRDLRADLEHLEVLRTYPIHPVELSVGELVSSTLFLAGVQAALLLGAVLLLPWSGAFEAWLPYALPAGLAALVLLLPLNAVLLAGQNLLVLLLPGWTRVGSTEEGGVEFMGRNLVMVLLALAIVVLVLLPPSAIGGAVGLALFPLIGFGSIVPALVIAWGVVLGEAVLAVLAMAELWRRIDPVEAGVLR